MLLGRPWRRWLRFTSNVRRKFRSCSSAHRLHMGNYSFLTGLSGGNGSPSVEEVLYLLENSSTIFVSAWQRVPPDLPRASRVSGEAMTCLDHVVNELLRARDTKKSNGTYTGSPLKAQLDLPQGLMFSPATRNLQSALITAGPGNGALPGAGAPITLEKLLNKIKHRHHNSANFRIDGTGRHIFLINVDKPNQSPDSIVEFDVIQFCAHCRAAAPHL